MAYTLLEKPIDGGRLPRTVSEEVSILGSYNTHYNTEREGDDNIIEDINSKSDSSQPSKVFSIGRNTHAQLGLGFSSQEATRGMVTGELEGKGGVSKVGAGGSGFSFVVTTDQDGEKGRVFGFGNDTLGQLGSSSLSLPTSASADPYDISTRQSGGSDAPQLKLLPLPKEITIGQEEDQGGWKLQDIAVGVDHSLILLERVINGYRIQQVLSTGLNTDGQLGQTQPDKANAVPIEPLLSRTFTPVLGLPYPITKGSQEGWVKSIVAGADTSYLLTREGELWVWGNSEYGQSFGGVHDRIAFPVRVPNPLRGAYTRHGLEGAEGVGVQKVVAGGSFAAVLDTNGRVFVVGYGPRGSSKSNENKVKWGDLELIDFEEGAKVEALFCGLEYIVAVTRKEEGEELGVWMWGLPPRSVSSLPMHTPTKIPFSIPKTPKQQWLDENPSRKNKDKDSTDQSEEMGGRMKVEGAACTRDHLLLLLNDAIGEEVWAECVQPPRGKGTDVTV